jgi:Na+/melibiose symporter-like transporter
MKKISVYILVLIGVIELLFSVLALGFAGNSIAPEIPDSRHLAQIAAFPFIIQIVLVLLSLFVLYKVIKSFNNSTRISPIKEKILLTSVFIVLIILPLIFIVSEINKDTVRQATYRKSLKVHCVKVPSTATSFQWVILKCDDGTTMQMFPDDVNLQDF